MTGSLQRSGQSDIPAGGRPDPAAPGRACAATLYRCGALYEGHQRGSAVGEGGTA